MVVRGPSGLFLPRGAVATFEIGVGGHRALARIGPQCND